MTPPIACLCVLLTQPSVEDIPALRAIYAPRFSQILFVTPFQQSAGDVVTVYRGPYSRSAYITDVLDRLMTMTFDHVLVIDHDVLLSPRIDERTFYDCIPLQPDDGFYPAFGRLPDDIGGWSRYFGIVPKLAFPKSLLFGSGLDKTVLSYFLPDRDESVDKLRAVGAPFTTAATLRSRAFGEAVAAPSRVLLHGETAALCYGTVAQRAADRFSMETEQALIAAMANAIAAEQPGAMVAAPRTDLMVPLSSGSVPACLYAIPRTRLGRFAHYAGVAAAANLDSDLVVPTLLHILCAHVRSAADYGMSVRGLIHDPDPAQMVDSKVLAVGPFLPGWFQEPSDRAALAQWLTRHRAGRHRRATAAEGVHRLGLGGTLQGFAHEGWHPRESWGRWMSQPEATIRFWLSRNAEIGALRLNLVVPGGGGWQEMAIAASVNGGEPQPVKSALGGSETEMTIAAADLILGSMNRIVIACDRMVRPAIVDPKSGDRRRLGIGIRSIEFASSRRPDRFAPPLGLLPTIGVLDDGEPPRRPLVAGLHGHEGWGAWSAAARAAAAFTIDPGVTVAGLKMRLRAPLNERMTGAFTGSARLNGGRARAIARRYGEADVVDVVFDAADVRRYGINTIEITSDAMVSPADFDSASTDRRQFGFALIDIEVITPVLDPLRLAADAAISSGHERTYREQIDRLPRPDIMVAFPGIQPVHLDAATRFVGIGWHDPDESGCWSAVERARFPLWVLPGFSPPRIGLTLQSPPSAGCLSSRGQVRYNDGPWVPIDDDGNGRRFAVLDASASIESDLNWIEVRSEDMRRPCDVVPGLEDYRLLGFGLIAVEFL